MVFLFVCWVRVVVTHLSDHGVECKAGHGADRDTLQAHGRAEKLGGNRPTQGTAGDEEDEVEEPSDDDESPMGAGVLRCRREDLDDDGVDDEGEGEEQASVNLQRSPADLVDGEDANGGAEEGDDGVDGLEQEREGRGDTDLGENLRREVLNRADTGLDMR